MQNELFPVLAAVEYLNEDLYNKVKKDADKKFSGNSYVKNLWIIREYKKRGGKVKYEGKKPSNTSIKKQVKGSQEILLVSYNDECEDCKEKDEIFGSEEELDEDNFYIPQESEYITAEEIELEESEVLEIDVAGLWDNIRKKKAREGKNYKPAKPGDKDRPSSEAWKKAQGAEYQGRKVTLNKPFRTPGGPKKFAVYTKNKSGNVVIVRFGDPNMKIKKNIPERRRSFRARHGCDTDPRAKDKTTRKYWSCRQW